MKIAFIGDSFCANVDKGTWPYIVAEKYNAKIISKGEGGIALFHSYEVLLEVVDEADYIIFCITDAHRLANRHKLPINGGHYRPLRVDGDNVSRKIKKATNLYYTQLMSTGFHQVSHLGILTVIDNLMLEKKKKCIWFPSLETELSMQGFIPNSGPISNCCLWQITLKEPNVRTPFITKAKNTLLNHLNPENNKNMSNLIIDIINSDDFSPRAIVMEEYFEVMR